MVLFEHGKEYWQCNSCKQYMEKKDTYCHFIFCNRLNKIYDIYFEKVNNGVE